MQPIGYFHTVEQSPEDMPPKVVLMHNHVSPRRTPDEGDPTAYRLPGQGGFRVWLIDAEVARPLNLCPCGWGGIEHYVWPPR